jgi:YHS domain-containing protein
MTDLAPRHGPETDPVCGMAVDPEAARGDGRTAEYEGRTYYFCSRGCLLEFADDPKRVFESDYVPHMH